MDATLFSADEPDGRRCPYCRQECDRHLLAFFDRYGDGLGLIGGALHPVEDVAAEVFRQVRLSWLSGDAAPPPWIAVVAALRFYFDWLGSVDCEDLSTLESEEDRACVVASAPGHRTLARDTLRSLLQEECGWNGKTTEWEKDDTPGLATVYELWWEPVDPGTLADRLRERLRVILSAIQAAPSSRSP
jgi:hypothetical protein